MTVVLGSGGPGPKRNNAIKHVLTTPDCEWIFFLDSDMTPEPQALMRLLAHDVPIAGALCYARLPPFHPVVGLLPGQERLDLTSGSFKAAWTGAAATLVRREVLEALAPGPYFTPPPGQDGSGDVAFCKRARAAGFPILIDPDVQVGHMATVPVDRQFSDALYAATSAIAPATA